MTFLGYGREATPLRRSGGVGVAPTSLSREPPMHRSVRAWRPPTPLLSGATGPPPRG
jgi:hypothetical protein